MARTRKGDPVHGFCLEQALDAGAGTPTQKEKRSGTQLSRPGLTASRPGRCPLCLRLFGARSVVGVARRVVGPTATMGSMALMLKLAKILVKGRSLTATPTAVECLPRVRRALIKVAKSRSTVTYGDLRAELALPYATNGMGRLLDLLSEDCVRRGVPSLASLVVNGSTGEVGSDFGGDPVAERGLTYEHWS